MACRLGVAGGEVSLDLQGFVRDRASLPSPMFRINVTLNVTPAISDPDQERRRICEFHPQPTDAVD